MSNPSLSVAWDSFFFCCLPWVLSSASNYAEISSSGSRLRLVTFGNRRNGHDANVSRTKYFFLYHYTRLHILSDYITEVGIVGAIEHNRISTWVRQTIPLLSTTDRNSFPLQLDGKKLCQYNTGSHILMWALYELLLDWIGATNFLL